MQTNRFRTPQQVEAMYTAVAQRIDELCQLPLITVVDASDLGRLGLTRLADELWPACSLDLRNSMLQHAHHFVRSCAVLSDQKLTKAIEGDLKEQPAELLRLVMRDLERQGAEMVVDSSFREKATEAGSVQNKACTALSSRMHSVRARLQALGYHESPTNNYTWI